MNINETMTNDITVNEKTLNKRICFTREQEAEEMKGEEIYFGINISDWVREGKKNELAAKIHLALRQGTFKIV